MSEQHPGPLQEGPAMIALALALATLLASCASHSWTRSTGPSDRQEVARDLHECSTEVGPYAWSGLLGFFITKTQRDQAIADCMRARGWE